MNSLPDATELIKTLKKAALDAFKAEKPTDVLFGKVISVSPLQINVEQQFILGAKQLVLTRNVTDFTTQMTVNWSTGNTSGGSGYDAFASHNHSISGKKSITVHNGLAVGDEVILIRKFGGQKFIVLDRIGS